MRTPRRGTRAYALWLRRAARELAASAGPFGGDAGNLDAALARIAPDASPPAVTAIIDAAIRHQEEHIRMAEQDIADWRAAIDLLHGIKSRRARPRLRIVSDET